MFRKNDKVNIALSGKFNGALLPATIAAIVGPDDLREYTAVDCNGTKHEGLFASNLRLVQPAPPLTLEGVTLKGTNGNRYAGTITYVNDGGSTIRFKLDHAKPIPGDADDPMSSVSYEYSLNPEGEEMTATFRTDGRWIVRGDDTLSLVVTIGVREQCEVQVIATPVDAAASV